MCTRTNPTVHSENPETRSQPLNSCQPENESVYTVLILVPEDLRDAYDSALWIWECPADHKQHAIDQSLEEVCRAFSQGEPDDFEVYGVVLGRLEFL